MSLLKNIQEKEEEEEENKELKYNFKQILTLLNVMLKRSARVEDTSIISHKAYISLVHLLLSKVCDGEVFWNLIALITRILLIYKFSECSDYFLESLNATKDVGALFVVSRVYFDHVATLVKRH